MYSLDNDQLLYMDFPKQHLKRVKNATLGLAYLSGTVLFLISWLNA